MSLPIGGGDKAELFGGTRVGDGERLRLAQLCVLPGDEHDVRIVNALRRRDVLMGDAREVLALEETPKRDLDIRIRRGGVCAPHL